MRNERIKSWFWDTFPATRPLYKYTALPIDGSIRLFVLEPGTGKQPLRGSLHTCTSKLDQAPYFEAVSYVWGSPDQFVELICDDQRIFITASLSDVLHRVRLPDRPRTLWADSICINQEDLDEKGSQVSLMGSIYRRSNRTLIHIGANDDGHGEPILGLLNDIDQNIFAKLQQQWDSAPEIDEDHPLIHDPRWKSLRHLLDTPWFWRGWVVQEAAHAQDGVVLWGDHEFSWTMIMKTYIWATRRAYEILVDFELWISALHVSSFSAIQKEAVQPFMPEDFWTKRGKVLDSLHSGRIHDLADPRDRIYAFQDLPTSHNSKKLQVIPSYRKSFFEMCKEFALNYLDVCDDLDLLLYVLHEEDSLTKDFPSWVPLWSPVKYSERLQAYFFDQAPLLERQEPKLSFCAGGNGLLVSGLRFANVRMVSEVLDKKWLTVEAIANLWSQVFDMLETETNTRHDSFSMFLGALYIGQMRFGTRNSCQDLAAFALEIFKTATGDAKRAIDYKRWEMEANGGDAERFLRSTVQLMARNKRFIVTDRGYGMAPAVAQEEDKCVIVRGGKMPFLLRKVDGAGNYKLVGCMFHSSEHEYKCGDTGCSISVGLEYGKDWTEWDIEEEKICLL